MMVSLIHPTMFYTGGAERVVSIFGKKLAERGYTVEIIALNFNEKWFQFFNNTANLYLKSIGRTITGLPYFLGIELLSMKLASLINENADILAPHNFPAPLVATYAQKRKSRLKSAPILWYCEEPFRFYYDREYLKEIFPHYKVIFNLSKMLYSGIDKKIVRSSITKILANSKFTADNIRKVYLRSASVCYLGTDAQKFKPIQNHSVPASVYSFRDGVDFILFAPLGRLGIPKNPLRLIYAARIIKDMKYNFRLLISGKGYLENHIKELLRKLGLKNNVFLLGSIEEEFLPFFTQ